MHDTQAAWRHKKRAAKGTSCEMYDTRHSWWKRDLHCCEVGGVYANKVWRRSEMVMQKQDRFSFWLSLYMWNWSYIRKCIISLKWYGPIRKHGCYTNADSQCLKSSWARKGKVGVFFHGLEKSARNNLHLVSCYSCCYSEMEEPTHFPTVLLPALRWETCLYAGFTITCEFYDYICCNILKNEWPQPLLWWCLDQVLKPQDDRYFQIYDDFSLYLEREES